MGQQAFTEHWSDGEAVWARMEDGSLVRIGWTDGALREKVADVRENRKEALEIVSQYKPCTTQNQ